VSGPTGSPSSAICDAKDVAGLQLPGFIAALPGISRPGSDLSVRYHPFRRGRLAGQGPFHECLVVLYESRQWPEVDDHAISGGGEVDDPQRPRRKSLHAPVPAVA